MAIGKILRAATLFTLALAQNNKNGQNQNQNQNQNNQNGQNNNAQAGNANLALDPNNVQKASGLDGQAALGAEDFQAASATSDNNFINFCQGLTLTNGLQITTGSCNGIVMGNIPAKDKMVSSVILNPKFNDNLPAGQDFNITVQVSNLAAGSFTNAVATYYSAPQDLKNGIIVGHTHVTVQDLGKSLDPQTPPDPTQFAFFKGINDAGNGAGLLSAVVAGGLPAGNYRVCTLTSASNHQPVIMPVAQRGAQDDCQKFVVSGNGGKANQAASNGDKGQAAQQQAQQAANLGAGAGANGNNTDKGANAQGQGQQAQQQGQAGNAKQGQQAQAQGQAGKQAQGQQQAQQAQAQGQAGQQAQGQQAQAQGQAGQQAQGQQAQGQQQGGQQAQAQAQAGKQGQAQAQAGKQAQQAQQQGQQQAQAGKQAQGQQAQQGQAKEARLARLSRRVFVS